MSTTLHAILAVALVAAVIGVVRHAPRRLAWWIAVQVVLVAAAVFLYVIYSGSGIKEDRGGYQLTVRFDRGGSVLPGTDVRISGVKIGAVTSQDFDPKMFQAVVKLNIRSDVELPVDSSAIITSDGLLGNYYIKLEPGAEDALLDRAGTLAAKFHADSR